MLSQSHLRRDYDSNRDSDPLEDESLGDPTANAKGQTLNYGLYSQMSKADWALYRSGLMKHNKTDYTNYEKTFDAEINS